MSLNIEKKRFLKKISGGLHVLMTCSYKADEIGAKPECPVEEFIKDNLITRNTSVSNVSRYWFSEAKFDTMVDIARDEDLIKLLKYFDDIDMYMKRVYYEAQPSNSSMSDKDFKFAALIHTGELVTFEDLLNHE
jgi:hypothetical protein